jgi:hypothetical protein
MSFRWGKTINAYKKWAFIFDREPPFEITTEQSSLSVSSYLRDVISYAHENSLKGADWYRKVIISPTDKNTIQIRFKHPATGASDYPVLSVFDLMNLLQNKKLKVGMKFYSQQELNEVTEVLELAELSVIEHGNDLLEVTHAI